MDRTVGSDIPERVLKDSKMAKIFDDESEEEFVEEYELDKIILIKSIYLNTKTKP